jgi:hypothetical protein
VRRVLEGAVMAVWRELSWFRPAWFVIGWNGTFAVILAVSVAHGHGLPPDFALSVGVPDLLAAVFCAAWVIRRRSSRRS